MLFKAKLSHSLDTVLHIAAASYDASSEDADVEGIYRIVNAITEEEKVYVLRSKNAKGNTPLHLAAKSGSVPTCKILVEGHGHLIAQRNDDGETPLFLAAHHNHMAVFFHLRDAYKNYKDDTDAFFRLLEVSKKYKDDTEVSSRLLEVSKKYKDDREVFSRLLEVSKNYKDDTDTFSRLLEVLENYEPHTDAFSRLLEVLKNCKDDTELKAELIAERQDVESLCKRSGDGYTFLHSVVSGEYYDSASQIIENFENFVHFKTVKGETPLVILANKPNSFESTSSLSFTDHIFYWCLDVLEVEGDRHEETLERKCPKNYVTLFSLATLLWKLIQKGIGWPWKWNSSCYQRDEENADHKTKEENKRFPSNYTTLINILKLLLMAALVVLGIGVRRIKRLQQKRERHKWANEIMDKMVQSGTKFFYLSDGQTKPPEYFRPFELPEDLPMYSERTGFELPEDLPKDDVRTRSELPEDLPKDDVSNDEKGRNNKGQQDTSDKEQKQLTATKKLLEGILDKFELEISSKGKNREDVLVLKTSSSEASEKPGTNIPILIAARTGIVEMVKKILETFPMAIDETDADKKNALLLAIENRQTKVFEFLKAEKLPEFVFKQVDVEGNSARHLAGMRGPTNSWVLPGAALQMHGESSWFEYVDDKLPEVHYAQYNARGKTPIEVFREEHEELRKEGAEWLIKTSESCSVVAALIATVAFATSVSVPGGVDDKTGRPLLEYQPLFHLFSVSSLVALCFSLTSLVFFLSIITSRCQVWDFGKNLPRKLLMGLFCLLTSIAAILVSFCAGHFFVLSKDLEFAALPIYTVTSVPLTIFAFSNVRLFYDLLRALCAKVPRRSY